VDDGVLKEIRHHDHAGESVLQKQPMERVVLDLPKVKNIKITSNLLGLGTRHCVCILMIA
jgi:hypothetical protein